MVQSNLPGSRWISLLLWSVHVFLATDYFHFMTQQYVITHVTTMMTASNGNVFRVTGPLSGEFTGPGEFPTQRPVTRSFDVFFHRRLNKQLSRQPRGWWFETPPWSLWRQCNDIAKLPYIWLVEYIRLHGCHLQFIHLQRFMTQLQESITSIVFTWMMLHKIKMN